MLNKKLSDTYTSILTEIKSRFFITVFADGEGTGEDTISKAVSDGLIAKARQEEKDKLYTEIQSLKDKIKVLSDTIQTKTDEIKTKDARIKELGENMSAEKTDLQAKLDKALEDLKEAKENKTKDRDKEVTKLQGLVNDLNTKIDELEASTKAEKEKLQLEIYKGKKIKEAGDEIVVDLVTGNTEEEIDASIEKAKKVYKEVVEKATQGFVMPTVNPGSKIVESFKTSAEDISKMNAKEYAEWRKKNVLK